MRDSKRDTNVQNSLLDFVGEGEGGMIWENGIETCIISYKKQMRRGRTFAVYTKVLEINSSSYNEPL